MDLWGSRHWLRRTRRSRAYRKNGNAHCEQKNWTHVRQLFGHDRFEHPELGRSFRYPGAPYALPASPWRISRRAPMLGEHDAEVFGS